MDNITLLRNTLVCTFMILFSNTINAQNFWHNTSQQPYGVQIGYVSKQWSTDFGNYTYKENLFGEEDERLHGLQLGFNYQPYTRYGIGLYTGLYCECYFASGKSQGYDNFAEFCGYLPIHASLRIPLSRNYDFRIHGGLGLNYVFHGEFYDDDYYNDYYRSYESDRAVVHYNRDGWPSRFNASAEIAVGLRIKSFNLNATYSAGLTDHKFYNDGPHLNTKQNKISLSVGWLFADD